MRVFVCGMFSTYTRKKLIFLIIILDLMLEIEMNYIFRRAACV